MSGVFDFSSPIYLMIRAMAGLGGLIGGYFLSGPVLRLLWRLAFQRAISPTFLPWAKLLAGLTLGALLFLFVPLGGSGGWGIGGLGSGSGGGPGAGDGKGDAKGTGATKDGAKKSSSTKSGPVPREILAIELLGGARYPGENKFYLLKPKDTPVTIKDVEDSVKKGPERVEIHLIFTPDSVGKSHDAAKWLRSLASKYSVPILERLEGDAKEPANK